MTQPADPTLSIIVAVVSDTNRKEYDLSILTGCLNSLQKQQDPPKCEVIIPYPAGEKSFPDLQEKYPEMHFLPVNDLKKYSTTRAGREHHDELRSRGIETARGEIIALIEDYGRAEPGWSRKIVDAHEQNVVAVGGAIENEIDRTINWSVYFCDFGKYQNPIPAGDSAFASDANTSYKRIALKRIHPFWKDAFHETEINWALRASGQKVVLSPEIVVHQHRSNLDFNIALKERFVWGRSYAATRISNRSWIHRLLYIGLSPLIPLVLLFRMSKNIYQKRRNWGIFIKCFPVTTLLILSWTIGELTGYISGKP